MKKAKKTVKTAKLTPFAEYETVKLPCNTTLAIRGIYKEIKVITVSTNASISSLGSETLISVAEQSIDPLITILRRAKLSLRK